MIKKIVALTTLLGACTAGQLMGMQETHKGHLYFSLDWERSIVSWAKEGMEFFTPPRTFQEKDILSVLSLNAEDHAKLVAAFKEAAQKKEPVKASYTLEQKQFLAKIRPLARAGAGFRMNRKEEETEYFVKITEQ